MVLVHDDKVKSLKEQLGTNHPIMGFREAKGLEFRDVLIVDFFSGLPLEDQKAWRELLRDRDLHPLQEGCPQLEGSLKLLYTAITRTSRRMFYMETKDSMAGRAFFKWLTQKGLAESQDASRMETAMTPDEWRSFGVEMAVNAEETEDSPQKALEWLDRSIFAFEQVDDDGLLRKARAHRAALVLRQELDEHFDDFEATDEKEEEVAQAAWGLAKEGVLPELYRLVEAVLPKLNAITQEAAETDILAKLEEYE